MEHLRYDFVLDGPEDWHIYEVREDDYDWDAAYSSFEAAKMALIDDIRKRMDSWSKLEVAVFSVQRSDAFRKKHVPYQV